MFSKLSQTFFDNMNKRFTFIAFICVLAVVFHSGCTSTILLGEHGCQRLNFSSRNQNTLVQSIHCGMSGEQIIEIMEGDPNVFIPPNDKKISWFFYLFVQEKRRNNIFMYFGRQAYFKFIDNKLVGYNISGYGKPEAIVGDLKDIDEEANWKINKYSKVNYTLIIDQLNELKYFFNDELKLFVKGRIDQEIDYWEGGVAHFKVTEVKPGFKRIYADNKYCDIPENAEFRGYRDGTFHYFVPHSGMQTQSNDINQAMLLQSQQVQQMKQMQQMQQLHQMQQEHQKQQKQQMRQANHPQPSRPPQPLQAAPATSRRTNASHSGKPAPNFKRSCEKHGEWDTRFSAGCPACRAPKFAH